MTRSEFCKRRVKDERRCLSERATAALLSIVLDHNGATAAQRAGYSPRSASAGCPRSVGGKRILDELQVAVEIEWIKGDPNTMIAGWRENANICGFSAPERKRVEVTTGGAGFMMRLNRTSDAEKPFKETIITMALALNSAQFIDWIHGGAIQYSRINITIGEYLLTLYVFCI